MKTRNSLCAGVGIAIAVFFAVCSDSFAQITSTIPVVTIQATDNQATWAGDPGTFTVFRSGNPTPALNVYYCISGTALNGVDYQTLSNWVQLPSGVLSNTIVVNPINLGQTNIRTVTITLCPSPLMIPVNYSIGSPARASVFITPPGVTNLPPLVALTSPADGAVFDAPANVRLIAAAQDPDGYVATVEFFAGTNSLGVRTNNPLSASPVNPFMLTWSNVPPGNFVLSALATDNGGASTVSDPVNITVRPPLPPTNLPPIVRMVSPPNGAIFRAPLDLPLFAYARDPDGFVVSVEFFDGTNSLGLGNNLATVPLPSPTVVPTNLWVLIWSNAPVGLHILTAEATDNSNAVTRSAPVTVAILPPVPPLTNHPPIVNIVAVDPVAIEGTNCYPWLCLTNATATWSDWSVPGAVFCLRTNCGPKNATFIVHRHGDTNDDLAVGYAIGGTASNGVDYVALPGVVTIPAGERSAFISVVPIDDGAPDITSTVRLKLLADTNSPLAYLLGFPRSAAAIILDGPTPRPVSGLLADKCFHLATTGPDGAWFHVEYSTDLLNWTAICTNQVVNGCIDFIDPDSPGVSQRFYHAVPENSPPLE